MANRVQEFLERIRSLSGLKNAILCGITVSKREMVAEFFLVTDRAYTTREEMEAKAICEEFLPSDFSATVKIVKRTPDAEMIKTRIFEFVCKVTKISKTIKLTAFAKCACPCEDCCNGVG